MSFQIDKSTARTSFIFRALFLALLSTAFLQLARGDSGFYKTGKHGNSIIGANRDSSEPVGNCSQCHLEHDGDFPFDYSLFGPDDNSLCQSSGCHEYQYQWPPGNYYWPYPGNVPDWYGSGHGSSTNVFPAGSNREVRLCVQCHNPHDAGDSTWGAFPSATGSLEENGCYSYGGVIGQGCHGNNNANRPSGAADIYSLILKPSRHNVAAAAKAHSSDWLPNPPYGRESRIVNSGSFSGESRHVECADCHNPHKSIPGNHIAGQNNIGGPLLGSWGVEPINSGPWTVPTLFETIDFSSILIGKEYQLCFKCHSYFAFGNNPPVGSTDIAREFNKANASYHPLEDTVRTNSYTSSSPTNGNIETMEYPWNNGRHDLMVCSDCHSSDNPADPLGPHGSNQAYILTGSASALDKAFCTKCHKATVYNAMNDPGSRETGSRFDQQTTGKSDASHYFHVVREGYGCRQCHGARQNSVPPSPERRSPYPTEPGSLHGANTFPGMLNGANISNYTPGSCTPSCHGRETYNAGPE